MRSVEDLLSLEAGHSGGAVGANFSTVADGFNLADYLGRTKSAEGGKSAIRLLAARDPEAAAEVLRKGTPEFDQYRQAHLAALEGRAEMAGEAEAARWISGMIDNLSGESRRETVRRLVGPYPTAHRLRALVDHLPTDDDRIALVAFALRGSRMDGTDISALTAMPTPAVRAEAISEWLQSGSPEYRNSGHTTTRLEDLMEASSLSPSQRDELRALLPPPDSAGSE